ncbi:hypothetical protein ONE63_007034 [Megalurothrips usitatus]|uniref:Intraflagellar transport protein 172 homolog n=1 Tax=Megalurothrips usitatus TaxID=439358 RepID=A0AAV7XU30_9NEOP|nr:hypothetical protein ONE63_007034 [Megalurothrips usitatus]
MRLKHLNTIVPAQDSEARITAIAWAPNNLKLAVCTSDRIVLLFDENGVKRDKFPTKPSDSKFGKKSYAVKGLAFSPDSTKVAVGQTDNIIYVYKLGDDWGDKKVICNKFPQQSAVTCLIWLADGPIICGNADGKVRAAHIKNNKTQTLYTTSSYVVSLAMNSQGTGFLSGHADGSIVRYYVTQDDGMEQQGRVTTHPHPVPPYALSWPMGCVIAAGSDKRISVYDRDGRVSNQFDYSKNDDEREFTVACTSPSGQAVCIGSYNKLRLLSWNPRKQSWEEEAVKEIPNLYTITAMAWKRDGSRVACGALCGSVELFESVIKRMLWKNKFEMTYVGPSQVLVKPLSAGSRGVVLRSQFGYEIDDVRIMGRDNYLVARTPKTLLLGDLERNLLSEVMWPNSGRNERFYFDNPLVCLIFNAGELSLVEYGNNHILGSVRTEFMNPHLISVRLNERRPENSTEDCKTLAYLLDLKTICIVDLVYGVTLSQVTHDSKIDWLELNETGQRLLFRDKKMRLTLLDIRSDTRTLILSYCTFVQWVPGSDVVVAQSRSNLCVWYNIDRPDGVTLILVKGEVTDVVRADGKTEVLVLEGHSQLSYELDEGLVEFGTAVHDNDFGRAVLYLETLRDRAVAEGMWQNLGAIALSQNNLQVAERCYAALGDVSRTHFLRETMRISQEYAKETGQEWTSCPEFWARMAILNNKLKSAEAIYLEQNQVDKAIDMYQKMHKWNQALSIAEFKGHEGTERLASNYLSWLIETKQDDKAGEVKEQNGEYEEALRLYLKAGLPLRASRLLQNQSHLLSNEDLVSRVSSALHKAELFEQAGQLYEKLNQPQKALDCYRKGHAYARAVELSRQISPSEVVILEEQWGDHLVHSQQLDAAINHYIEAGKMSKALDAAVGARQWRKAEQIIQVIKDNSIVEKYSVLLGQHFASVQDYSTAEKLYSQAGMFKEAVEMYNKAGLWEKAHMIANQHLQSKEVNDMYTEQAALLQQQGKFREAEKLFVSVGQPDAAISMYKQQKQYDQMMRLVSQYHADLVQTTHLHLGQQLEAESSYASAEHHYIQAGDWKSVVNMYRTALMWEDAYRVANQKGGAVAAKQVAFLWSKSLGGDSAMKLLNKLNLLEPCIDYACETYQFDFAFDLAKLGLKSHLPQVHCKYAMALEDDGKFQEAEEEFVKAGKPKEAVLMYIHNQDWDNAARVAELHDPDSVSDVLIGQAKEAFARNNLARFESLMLRAHKPEFIIKQYKDAGMWVDALRVCREYLPVRLPQLQMEYEQQLGSASGSSDVSHLIAQAKEWEESGEYKTAVDCLIRASLNANDSSLVLRALSDAAEITMKFLEGNQAMEAVRILGPRLVEMKQSSLAAQLYLATDLSREAIDVLIQAGDWNKAKKIAKEYDPSYEAYVEGRQKDMLRSQGRVDQLADVDVISALDLMVEQSQWDRCIEAAAPHGPQVLHKYVALYASQLIKDGLTLKALGLYVKYDTPAFPQNFNIYRRIALDLFSMPGLDNVEAFTTWTQLRTMLFSLTETMRTSPDGGSPVHQEFETLLKISHYYTLWSASRATPSMEQIAFKLATALLRHSDIIPADKAFYEAGMAARSVGRDNEAFVFLNHYLDICEAIEEGNADLLDHSDLNETDFPQEIPLPPAPYLNPQQHEEVKEWVLAVSMDQKVDQELPLDERNLYASSLRSCNKAEPAAFACVVTGYPVLGVGSARIGRHPSPVEFQRSGYYANQEDWNSLLMAAKLTGVSSSNFVEIVDFISEWCGGSSSVAGSVSMPGFSFK